MCMWKKQEQNIEAKNWHSFYMIKSTLESINLFLKGFLLILPFLVKWQTILSR